MIKEYNITKEEMDKFKKETELFKQSKDYKYEKTEEADIHYIIIDNKEMALKIFTNEKHLQNKLNKIKLIKERLGNNKSVVTAEYLAMYNGNFIGYIMPYIEGKMFNTPSLLKKKDFIPVLKKISELLKELHKQNIIVGDFNNNTMIDKNNNIYFIDHDNFAIDNYKIDVQNLLLINYLKKVSVLDKNFDNYLLNIATLSNLTHIRCLSLENYYKDNQENLKYKDKEINKIIKNTFEFNDSYKEDIIVDKINSKKDYKKIRRKIF